MANKANSLAHTKWTCKYHIVFTPKYRRKIIYNQYKESRVENVSWWRMEMPSQEEYAEARENLKCANYEVDYIISHAAPEDTMSRFHPYHFEEQELNDFLEWVRENVKYKHWYFGHLHADMDTWREQTVLWYDIRNITTNLTMIG